MYRAKALGKGRYALYDPSFSERFINRLGLENRLQKALENDEMRVHYQPIFSLENNQACGVEALCRWYPVDGNPVPPVEFIPLAEASNQIIPIEEWVLRTACQRMTAWQDQFPVLKNAFLSVNLSPKQFDDPHLVERISSTLREANLPPERLHLEITESAFLGDEASVIQTLQQLIALGVNIYLDDFGIGYSSLWYLERFPVNGIKIAQHFTGTIKKSTNKTGILGAIFNMVHSMGLRTIVEGVETEYQLEKIKELDGQCCQGFLLSKPLDDSGMLAFLNDQQIITAGRG
jgi:EAL domain-containing protein (putative c-di-GMP-specific phosphodiesterase class I)